MIRLRHLALGLALLTGIAGAQIPNVSSTPGSATTAPAAATIINQINALAQGSANTLTNAVAANKVYAGPGSGVAAAPGYRLLVPGDMPLPGTLSVSGTLTGAELVYIEQSGVLYQTTLSKIVALAPSGGSGSGFITGTTTSAALIAAYPPSTSGGKSAQTSDMGLMSCDGVRWNVVGTPPIPPGALSLGYSHNVYTIFPTVADIGYGTTSGGNRIYAGYLELFNSTSAGFTTAANGQLQLIYSGTSGTNGIFTIVPYHTAPLSQDYGQLGTPTGAGGWYAEIAYTGSTNNTDVWDAFFVEAQEHNPLKIYDRPGSPYPALDEHFTEVDISESGHGTDYSGQFRGNYIQWSGAPGLPITLAAAYGATTTSISLASPWTGETSFAAHQFSMKFNSGELRNITLVNGSTGPYSITALSSAETTAATLNGYASLTSAGFSNTASLDYTVEHIFGASYDPILQQVNFWQDGVYEGSISTNNVNSNAFRDSLHNIIIVNTNSHGAHVAHTMTVRYVSMWTP